MAAPVTGAQRHEYGSYDELLEDYFERGWTDGLPIVPPTPEKVAAFLAAAGLAGEEVLGEVPTREVRVTAEHAAINAVMAGCRRDYFPVVVAAVRAHLHEKANCHSTTGTLSGAVQTVVVNGPIRTEIGIECGAGCMGPGFRANASIGRALRLMIATSAARSRACSTGRASRAPTASASASARTKREAAGRRCTWSAASDPTRARSPSTPS